MMTKTSTTRAMQQRGFSLVEVLVALIVISVGMLGIASLYVQSLQAGRTSLFRHNAVTLAGDVADRIRANPAAGAAYEGGGADNACIAAGVTCNAPEMAAQDIWLWQQQAADTLPAGNVAITFNAALGGNPPTYDIVITWNEPGITAADNVPPNYSVRIPVLGI